MIDLAQLLALQKKYNKPKKRVSALELPTIYDIDLTKVDEVINDSKPKNAVRSPLNRREAGQHWQD
jgi:hypothetical protein